MQFRGTPHHAVFEISDDDGAIFGAFRGIAFNKTVVQDAREAVARALGIEPQKMIAQQRQFFLLLQRPDVAPGTRRTGRVLVVHFITPLGNPSRRRRIPSSLMLCIATRNSRLLNASNNGTSATALTRPPASPALTIP